MPRLKDPISDIPSSKTEALPTADARLPKSMETLSAQQVIREIMETPSSLTTISSRLNNRDGMKKVNSSKTKVPVKNTVISPFLEYERARTPSHLSTRKGVKLNSDQQRCKTPSIAIAYTTTAQPILISTTPNNTILSQNPLTGSTTIYLADTNTPQRPKTQSQTVKNTRPTTPLWQQHPSQVRMELAPNTERLGSSGTSTKRGVFSGSTTGKWKGFGNERVWNGVL